jgi:general secretion pathway protein E
VERVKESPQPDLKPTQKRRFGLSLNRPGENKLKLDDLLAALQADGLITDKQHKFLWGKIRPKDLQTEHPITLIANEAWAAADSTGNLLTEERITMWLADLLGMKYLRIDPLKVDVHSVASIASFAYTSKRHILPVEVTDNYVVFATTEPMMSKWKQDMSHILSNKELRVVLTTPANLKKYSVEFYSLAKSVNKATADEAVTGSNITNLEQLVQLGEAGDLDANNQHIVHIVDWLLQYAFEQRASDIHLEPRRDMSFVRFRIDGMLHMVYEVPTKVMGAIISRIKSLGGMDVIDKRRPQDGRVKTRTPKGNEVELRLSTLPTAFGEKMVMRIFDPEVLVKGFSQLGFSESNLNLWQEMVKQPNGIILVTGPTGSGKTTTLYSTLRHIARPEVNVCTVEDPIELLEPKFNQMQVQSSIDLSFADGIKALLRQDPDIIMVGEIRDLETAQMAVQASLTGHLVFSTLHTNSAVATVVRLIEIGMPDYLIRSTLLGVVAQRLLRTLCPHCTEKGDIEADVWEQLISPLKLPKPEKVNRPVGCLECRNTGYLGRVGIYEMLKVTDTIKQLIKTGGDQREMERLAIKEGMRTLKINGALKIASGVTTPEEVIRVVSIA